MTQPGSRQSQVSPNANGVMRLLDLLGAGKLALVLIALLIGFSVAGAMLPQPGQMSEADIARWQVEYPRITALAEPLGLFHVLRSWPFLATIVLLAVNTLTCTVLHLARNGGFRDLPRPLLVRRVGFVTLHLSLLLLFAGGFFSAAADLDGKIILTEGQQFTDAHDNYLQLQEGPLRRERHTGLAFRLDDVDIQYEKKRYAVSVTSKLAVRDGDRDIASGVVQVNRPFEFRDLSFTQDETGFSPRLVIRHAARNMVLVDSYVALRTRKTQSGREYRDVVPLPFSKQRVIVSLIPTYRRENGKVITESDAPDHPLLVLELEGDSGKVVDRAEAELGERVTLGRDSFEFADLRRWASFRVGHDPGYPLVCAALWLGLIAMIVRYAYDIRNWAAQWSSSNATVTTVGTARNLIQTSRAPARDRELTVA